jgi:hypothetical protein
VVVDPDLLGPGLFAAGLALEEQDVRLHALRVEDSGSYRRTGTNENRTFRVAARSAVEANGWSISGGSRGAAFVFDSRGRPTSPDHDSVRVRQPERQARWRRWPGAARPPGQQPSWSSKVTTPPR